MSQPVAELSSSKTSIPDDQSSGSSWANSDGIDEFDYIPVSPWGPISLIIGIGGLTGYLGVFGLGLAFFGILIGIAAVMRIRGARGSVKGMGFAMAGLALSIANLGGGSAWMAHSYSIECPEGYARVNFPNDISDKQFVYYGFTATTSSGCGSADRRTGVS